MKTSKKEVHKWLRKHESISTGVMMNKDGKPTANKDDMSNLIRGAWDKVFNKYSRGTRFKPLFPKFWKPHEKPSAVSRSLDRQSANSNVE
jgi:hypothetical protein